MVQGVCLTPSILPVRARRRNGQDANFGGTIWKSEKCPSRFVNFLIFSGRYPVGLLEGPIQGLGIHIPHGPGDVVQLPVRGEKELLGLFDAAEADVVHDALAGLVLEQPGEVVGRHAELVPDAFHVDLHAAVIFLDVADDLVLHVAEPAAGGLFLLVDAAGQAAELPGGLADALPQAGNVHPGDQRAYLSQVDGRLLGGVQLPGHLEDGADQVEGQALGQLGRQEPAGEVGVEDFA